MERNLEPLSVPQLQEDWISVLPDDILVGILSTLKFKEAVQTSVLSHRWLNLWRHVPRLHFDCTKHLWRCYSKEKWGEARPVFANWVNRVLQSHQSSNLQEFRILFDLDSSYQKEIDKWLQYAFDKRLQSFDLNLTRVGNERISRKDSYTFPNQLLNQTTQFGVQLAPKVGCFSCLKVLYFTAINITGEAIEQLLLKCPLLEDLRVVGSSILTNLVVSGPSLLLKHLEITSCRGSLTISDTNLVSLKLSTTAKRRLMFINLPMLIDIDVRMYGNFPDNNMFFSKFSCCLSQLTVLTIRAAMPKEIMDLYKFPELQNLRRLVLVALFCDDTSLIGLTSLIDSCPRLVEFALRLNPLDNLLTRHREQKKAMEQSLKCLKVFELHGYHGNTYESELIMFFIENAVALEKVVIDPHIIHAVYLDEPVDDQRTKDSRRHAIEKFEGIVPQHVELVIP